MNLETVSLIVNIIFIMALVIGIIIIDHKHKKSKNNVDILSYLSNYSDKIEEIANQISGDLNVTQEDYDSDAESINNKLIEKIIDTLVFASTELGIDMNIIGDISNEALSQIIHTILNDKLSSIIETNINTNGTTEPTTDKTEEVVSKNSITTDKTTSDIGSTLDNFYKYDDNSSDI